MNSHVEPGGGTMPAGQIGRFAPSKFFMTGLTPAAGENSIFSSPHLMGEGEGWGEQFLFLLLFIPRGGEMFGDIF